MITKVMKPLQFIFALTLSWQPIPLSTYLLVTTVILHAPTIVFTPVSLGYYSNALSTVSVVASASAVLLDEEVGLAQLISKS